MSSHFNGSNTRSRVSGGAGRKALIWVVLWAWLAGAGALLAAPFNNNCKDATTNAMGSLLSGTLRGTNVGANLQGGELVVESYHGKSIWYRWRTPLGITNGTTFNFFTEGSTTTNFSITTNGAVVTTNFNTLDAGIQIFISPGKSDPDVGDLLLVAGDNDRGDGLAAHLVVNANPTNLYSIQLTSDDSDDASTNFVLRWVMAGSGATNDNLGGGQLPSSLFGSINGQNTNATREFGEREMMPNGEDYEGVGGGRSIWYKWTAPSNGTFAFNTRGSGFDTLMGVYSGSTHPSLAIVEENDDDPSELNTNFTSLIFFDAFQGAEYKIRVDGFDGEKGATVLNWALMSQITNFSPVAAAPGTLVTISGIDFAGITNVQFGGVSATSFTQVNSQTITAVVPSNANTGFIRVMNLGGEVDSTNIFAVLVTPVITGFSPASGPAGATVTITGVHLTSTVQVRFNGVNAASITNVSDTTVRAVVPVGASTGPISLTTIAGMATSASNFVFVPPPVITSFTPTIGGGGTQVNIYGTNFNGATAVAFNGMAAAFTVVNNTNILATVIGGSTSGPISVTTVGGTAFSAQSFTFVPPPAVTGFSPSSGGPGASVVVTGSNLTTTTTVRFNGVSASFTVNNDSNLTATVPVSASTGPISVTTPGGTAASAGNFTFVPAPIITGFSPGSGGPGFTVQIFGTNLAGASVVRFGGASASFTVNSTTNITATVPANAVTGLITVTTGGGTAFSAGTFQFIPAPMITGFSPGTGGPGMLITINGIHLTNASSVTFNGAAAAFTVVSPTNLTATVPAGASTGPITVTTPGGMAMSAAQFMFVPAPVITSFSPTSGIAGTSVSITGVNFTNATAVMFNGANASFLVNSGTSITATVPAGASTGPIMVMTAGGTANSTNSFVFVPPPIVSSFSPASGGPGFSVQIRGTNFSDATEVRFNGVVAAFTINSATNITATVPAGASTGPISVISPSGTGLSGTHFTFIPAPVVTGFTPGSGGVGASVSVVGQNFSNATSVTFNGVAASFTVNSGTNLSATVPAGATTGPIAVTTPGGTAASGSAFSFNPAPVVSGFTPGSGGVGASVSVSGQNFSNVTAVAFNGVTASFTVNSATNLSATVPAGASTGPISVTTAGGTAASAAAFSFIPAPVISGFTPTNGGAGASVSVSGLNFSNVTAVAFNGVAASFTVNSATNLSATVPAGATTGPISVTTPGGTAASAAAFTFIPAPVITSFDPTSGGPGAVVTLHGQNFSDATSVTFNGATAVFTVNSQSNLTATVPTNASTGPIAVTTPGGTGASGGSFTFLPPGLVSGFTPAAGVVGTQVEIYGQNFSGATAVQFNGVNAFYLVNSSTQATAIVPAAASTGPITVMTVGGPASSGTNFTVIKAPAISGFSPTNGAIGAVITLSGTNFAGVTNVLFNGAPAAFTVDANTSITATVPTNASTGPITVMNAAGNATSATSFVFIPPPVVAGFTPGTGGAGASVTINGVFFDNASSVLFNGVAAVFTIGSSSNLTATVPAAAGTGPITVTTPGGTAVSTNDFVFIFPPVISGFTPVRGGEGTTVAIAGTNFTDASSVLFNGVSAVYVVDSATNITATVPAEAGSGLLSVTTPGGTAVSAASFFFLPAPVVGEITFVGDLVSITFGSVTGVNYAVEYTDSVAPASWQNLTNLAGDGTLKTVQQSVPGAPQRIYRVRAE